MISHVQSISLLTWPSRERHTTPRAQIQDNEPMSFPWLHIPILFSLHIFSTIFPLQHPPCWHLCPGLLRVSFPSILAQSAAISPVCVVWSSPSLLFCWLIQLYLFIHLHVDPPPLPIYLLTSDLQLHLAMEAELINRFTGHRGAPEAFSHASILFDSWSSQMCVLIK